MIRKLCITLGLLLLIQIFSLSIVYGEMEQDSSKDFSELLKDENESKFFTNQKSGDFQKNFLRKETQGFPKSILIKDGTSVKLAGTLDREFSTILVEGNLIIVDTGDSALKVQKLIVGPTGSLTIGTEENPIDNDKNVEIVFINNKEGETGIFVFGKLWIHGTEVYPTFVELKNDARTWTKNLMVETELENWKRDDVIVITSPGDEECNEIIKISKIIKTNVLLQSQLNCFHRGSSNPENPIVSHVALLSRNVKISSEDEVERGSVNFFHGSTGYIKYAQFDKLGPKEVLARYPIHFHHMKDTSRGIEVVGNSITNSDNRWITIHDSNGIIVRNNVGYISQGHGFFLEDGNEFDNVFEKNIGIITKKELITNSKSSVFWTMNPMNVYRENVAVNAHYWGFSFEIPNTYVDLPKSDKKVNLRSLPSLDFDSNTAYNYRHGGVKVSRPTIYDKSLDTSDILISNFSALSSPIKLEYHFGILIGGSDVSISNSTLINNKFGIYLGGERNKVFDTSITFERSMIPDKEISGIVIAGGNNWIENSKINGYISKNKNQASDISISNNENNQRLLSAKIINTTLLDPLPIYFGNPANEKSFLKIYGHNAPFGQTKKLPENFILKEIGSDIIEQRGEYNNLEFNAMIKMLPEIQLENPVFSSEDIQIDDDKKTNSKLIKNFKNNAFAWSQNNISDKEFMNEIEILFESRLVEIVGIDQGSFNEIQFSIPHWVKQLVSFWSVNTISDQEFINAIEYILNSNLAQQYSPYN